MYFIHYSGFVADRVNLRYFLTTGMIGQLICKMYVHFKYMYIYVCV